LLLARDVTRNLATAQPIEEGTSTLDLRLEPGLVVASRVEDAAGKPLTNAVVRIDLWAGNSAPQLDSKRVRPDAPGRFEFTALPAGRKYSLWASAKGYGTASQNIQEDADTNRVELPPFVLKVADRKLSGQVVDIEERPASGANVYIYGEGQPTGSVHADQKGRFRFDSVCEGRIQLSARLQNASGSLGAEAGATNVVIRLGMNQSYPVR
jgi:protocatechuate 3,4-dioxygenase beta subunit